MYDRFFEIRDYAVLINVWQMYLLKKLGNL